jgi:hypothetical protein
MMILVACSSLLDFSISCGIGACIENNPSPFVLMAALILFCQCFGQRTVLIAPVTILICKLELVRCRISKTSLLSDTGGVATRCDPPNVLIGSAAIFVQRLPYLFLPIVA